MGNRLRLVRGSMNQDTFARCLGTEKNTIGRYERGERQPDAAFLKKLQSEFMVSIDWLVSGVGEAILSMEKGQTLLPTSLRSPSLASALAVSLDVSLLALILSEVWVWLADHNEAWDSQKVGERVGVIYGDILRASGEKSAPEVHRALLKMALLQWERETDETVSSPS